MYLRLWRGNLLVRTQYAALRTDSLTSVVQSIITCDVAIEGGNDSTIVLRTSCTRHSFVDINKNYNISLLSAREVEKLTALCSMGSTSRNKSKISLFSPSFAKRERALTANVRIIGTLSLTRSIMDSITSSQTSLLTSASSGNRITIYKWMCKNFIKNKALE